MKSRNGLVSNSSSSSFVISIKDPNTFRVLGYTLEELGCGEYGYKIHNQTELDDYYSNNLESIQILKRAKKAGSKEFHHERQRYYNLYHQIQEELKKNKIICFGSCSDSGPNVVQRGLCGGGWEDLPVDANQEMVVLQDCDGY